MSVLDSPGFMAAVLVFVTLAAIGVSVWRLTQGGPTDRLRGCVGLLVIVGGLILVISTLLIMTKASGQELSWPSFQPIQYTPGPSFATPESGGSLP